MSNPPQVISLKFFSESAGFTFDVGLDLPRDGITAIFGRSGSGKTTLLRCIAGLENMAQGFLRVGDEIWQSPERFMPTYQRDIGYVFQESSLFEHLDVKANLDYGRRRSRNGANDEEYSQLIALLGIEHLLTKTVSQLSGGERQRVAIARALLLKPSLLLFDEPLASLDHQRKLEILSYLEKLPREWHIPILYVSHSADEVTRLADYLVILEEGKVKLHGDIRQVMAMQDIPWLLSEEPFSLLFGVVDKATDEHGLTRVAVDETIFLMPQQKVKEGQTIRLHLYAKDISLALERPMHSSILNIYPCAIAKISEATEDGQCFVHLQLANSRIVARISRFSREQLALQVGQSIFAQIKAVSVVQ